MVVCKCRLFCERCWTTKKLRYGYRCLSNRISGPIINYSDDFIQVIEGNNGGSSSRTAVINRASSLNAINNPMAVRLRKLYREWEDDPDIGFVMLKGRGRAFSAGGDLRSLYNLMKQGKLEECKELFRNVYGLVHNIATYSKPHVSSCHVKWDHNGWWGRNFGPWNISCCHSSTIFAAPETLVGFHPDGGASFYLSRLPGHLGEYLALLGNTLNGAEMIWCGLATHYMHTTKLMEVEKVVGNLATKDPSVVRTCLESFQESVHHLHHTSLLHRLETVDRCFSQATVEEIIQSLECEAERNNDAWCESIVKKLKEISPLSLKVALRSIREGRSQSLEQCLVREYRMTLQALSKQISPDLYEGIRARLVDKDCSPKWDPPSLEHVSQDMVDRYFSPLSPYEPQLELPKRENMLS